MKFVTLAELENDIISNLHKIPHNLDLIVGVPRSGMLVASLIALHLNVPLTDLYSFAEAKYYPSGTTKVRGTWAESFSDMKNVLVVEDSVLSGKSIIKAKQLIGNSGFDITCLYFAAYVTPEKKDLVDFFLKIIRPPRIFEWNLMHTKFLANACVDIDGVLCVDPTSKENDDGENYQKFLKETKVKFQPTFRIGYIVSSRLEKYRKETEEWLEKNNIDYEELILSDYGSAKERQLANSHAESKARVYKMKKKAFLFIESDENQAIRIAKITGKPVFCVDNQTYYNGDFTQNIVINTRSQLKNKFIQIVARVLPYKIKLFLKKIMQY